MRGYREIVEFPVASTNAVETQLRNPCVPRRHLFAQNAILAPNAQVELDSATESGSKKTRS